MSVLSGASMLERAAERPSNDAPFYLAIGEECTLFEMAFRERLPLLLKGPTGCGKTRLRRPHGGAARFAAADHLLSRRSDRRRPHRPRRVASRRRPDPPRQPPADHIGMTVQELSGRMDHIVGAQRERLLKSGRKEGVVDRDLGPSRLRLIGNAADIDNPHQGIARRFDQQQRGRGRVGARSLGRMRCGRRSCCWRRPHDQPCDRGAARDHACDGGRCGAAVCGGVGVQGCAGEANGLR